MCDQEKVKNEIEVWKTVVQTQQHFNELEMKVRNFGILIIAAFVGAIGVSFRFPVYVDIFSLVKLHPSSVLAFLAVPIWTLFYFVDVFWYHPLLLGAVKQGLKLEESLKNRVPGIELTETIGKESPIELTPLLRISATLLLVRHNGRLRSTDKAHLFYRGVLIVLLVLGIAMAGLTIPNVKTVPPEETGQRYEVEPAMPVTSEASTSGVNSDPNASTTAFLNVSAIITDKLPVEPKDSTEGGRSGAGIFPRGTTEEVPRAGDERAATHTR